MSFQDRFGKSEVALAEPIPCPSIRHLWNPIMKTRYVISLSVFLTVIGLTAMLSGCTSPTAAKALPRVSIEDQIRGIEMSDRPPQAKAKAIEKLRAQQAQTGQPL